MVDDRSVIHRVAWLDVCPWLMIFRVFRLSISLPVLFLATVGALLTVAFQPTRLVFPTSDVTDLSLAPYAMPGQMSWPLDASADRMLSDGPMSAVYSFFANPVWRLFDSYATTKVFLQNLITAGWNVLVWSLFGGAITRVAVVQLGRDERLGTADAVRHAVRNWGWYAAAPLFPLLGVALLMLPLAVLGLLGRLDLFVLVAGILWPFVLVAGLAMTLLLMGLLVGWPLMWPTISAESDSDAFEAFNRSFSYSFQRPLQYLFYAVLAVLFGQLSWFLVEHFAGAVVGLSHWAVTFGAGLGRTTGSGEDPSSLLRAGAWLIAMWDGLVFLIARAFRFSFFFCAASAIYLLLRREVDQTDFDDVFREDESIRYGLPQLRPGPGGVPEVAESGK
ncbi:MAG: hypothetical protein AB7F89_04000 [Pirellulaceae bacterium]